MSSLGCVNPRYRSKRFLRRGVCPKVATQLGPTAEAPDVCGEVGKKYARKIRACEKLWANNVFNRADDRFKKFGVALDC